MSSELVSLIIALAPIGAQLISQLITALTGALDVGHTPDTLTSVTKRIVDGINIDHPDWPAEQRARYAADAIAVWVRDHPAPPKE